MENLKQIPENVALLVKEKFEELYKLDIKGMVDVQKIENKKTGKTRELTYLSWSKGYKIMREQDPSSTMEFLKNGDSYLFPETTEQEVCDEVEETETTVVKEQVYDKDTKELSGDPKIITTTRTVKKKVWRTKKVTTYMVKTEVCMFGLTLGMNLPVMDSRHDAMELPTTRDISDSLMRCFVKNLALFGIGLPLYNKEDLERYGIEGNNAPENPLKAVKDFVMNAYRESQDPRVKRAITDYSSRYGMLKDLNEKQLNEIAEIIKGFSL